MEGASKLAGKFGIPQLVIGTAALIAPIPFEQAFIADALAALAAGVMLWLGVVGKQQLRRPCGVVMLAAYGAYLGYLLAK